MVVPYLEFAFVFAVLHYVPVVLGLAYPSEMELLFNQSFSRAERLKFLARGLARYGLFWPVVACTWFWSLMYRALAELVLFLLKATGFYRRLEELPLERTERKLDAMAGWVNILSLLAAVATTWFIWRAFVLISDR